VPTDRELTSDPKALALIAFAETPFLMALPLVTSPGIPAGPTDVDRPHGRHAEGRDCAVQRDRGV